MVVQLKWLQQTRQRAMWRCFFKINPIQKHLYFKVLADKDLVAVNEQVQLKALKMFYDR